MDAGNYTDSSDSDAEYSRRDVLKQFGTVSAAGIIAGCTGSAAYGNDADSSAAAYGDDATDSIYTGATTLGGNLNGQPRTIAEMYREPETVLDQTATPVTRSFFDVLQMVDDNRDPYDDPDVAAVRQAGNACDGSMLSFKWDFLGYDERVPAPGSDREQALFDYATDVIDAVNTDTDGTGEQLITLGNEPMWETPDADQSYVNGAVPFVEFTANLKEHLAQHYANEYPEQDPQFVLGSLNRLDKPEHQENPLVQEYLRQARDDDLIAGVDLHLHYSELAEANAMLDHARTVIGDEPLLTVSEFSPVWRYKQHVNDALGATAAGQAFAETYGHDGDMSVDQYLQHTKEGQISREEWTDFTEAMPWFNERHVSDMYQLFNGHDVDIATVGFSQDDGMRNGDWTRDTWKPFHINFLFVLALVDADRDIAAYNEHYMRDYRHIQNRQL